MGMGLNAQALGFTVQR